MQKSIFLALLLACSTSQASEWVSVGKSADGTKEWFIDASSIRISKSIRRAWIKTVFAPHTQQDTVLHSGKWLAHLVEHDVFNCGEEKAGIETITAYYEGGGNDSAPYDSKATPMELVPPDTAQTAELKFICAWKPK